jgi:hypothetical protein
MQRNVKITIITMLFIAAVAMSMPPILRWKEKQHLSAVRAIKSDNIATVTIHEAVRKHLAGDWQLHPLILEISDRASLKEFATAMNYLEDYIPNHPQYVRELYVVLLMKDGSKFEFKFCLMQPPDETVYIYLVRKSGRSTRYLAKAMSPYLYTWLREAGALY